MHPRDIRISDYTYSLPEGKIAAYPLAERDLSRLLIYDHGSISGDIYRNLSHHIPPGSFLVFNDTKVVHARLLFPKESGAVIEIFCLEPDDRYADITTGMNQTREVYWKCLVGKAGKWKEKELHLHIASQTISGPQTPKGGFNSPGRDVLKPPLGVWGPGPDITLTAQIHEKLSDSFVIHLSWDTDATFAEILHLAGAVPLPPYIKRRADVHDSETYQTIYSRAEGSVAAPTAGLHFTPQIFDSFRDSGIDWDFVTLHVGAGTFKPVKSELISDHQMHAEWIEVTVEFIRKLTGAITQNKNIIAIGTTATRTLESLYWLGVIVSQQPHIPISELHIRQWDAYELKGDITTLTALDALEDYLMRHGLQKLVTRTQLLIAPGYDWMVVSELITNFHQPGSTLLLLVAALIGDDWRRVYDYALAHDFRFLSYGDGGYFRR